MTRAVTPEIMALDGAGEAFTLAHARHIHALPFRENVQIDVHTARIISSICHAEFSQ